MRILLIEDHSHLAASISAGLADYGFGIDAFQTGNDGLNAFETIAYDAVILDLRLPDRDGMDVLRDLRESGRAPPVLILTARDGIDDRVNALDAGADDYVVKPFAMKELAARLRALLRRPVPAPGKTLSVGNLQLETVTRQVTVNGRSAHLSAREIQALELLIRREGRIVARRSMEESLYGPRENPSSNSIEVLISRLRRRLRSMEAACSIRVHYGAGYSLTGDAS